MKTENFPHNYFTDTYLHNHFWGKQEWIQSKNRKTIPKGSVDLKIHTVKLGENSLCNLRNVFNNKKIVFPRENICLGLYHEAEISTSNLCFPLPLGPKLPGNFF